MELNRENIIKALECCTRGRKSKEDRPCLDCPYNECNIVGGTSERQISGTCQGWLMKDALSLIKSQDQKIFELENRLKECENGYEGTLSLDRCKLHDAEEKVKELTAKITEWEKECDLRGDMWCKLNEENKKLTEENERLNASCTELERKCASLDDENERLRSEKEAKNKELFYKWKKIADETADRYEGLYQDAKKALVADTVRQMRPAIIEEVISAVDKAFERQIYESKWVDENLEVVAFTDVAYAQECWDNCIKRELMKKFEEKKVDQIAKEMLEGETK